jgi:electron transfer flavoprotein alpha subunit
MTYVAFMPLPLAATPDRIDEMLGLLGRAGLAVADGRVFVYGDGVPARPSPAPMTPIHLASPLAEPDVGLAAGLARAAGARFVLLPDDGWTRAFAVRLALALDAVCLTGVTELLPGGDGWIARRPSHGGRVNADVPLGRRPAVLTVAKGIAGAAQPMEDGAVDAAIDATAAALPGWLAEARLRPDVSAAGLEQAETVLVAGRGAGSRANIEHLGALAAALGMAFAVSRPVVMNAWAPMDRLAGVSGAMLKPRLAILAGVSGAPALMAAVKRSRVIIAINTDAEAPVFRSDDLGIVGDCRTLLDGLAERLKHQ